MRFMITFILLIIVLFMTSCSPSSPVCSPGATTYLDEGTFIPTAPANDEQSAARSFVDVHGKTIEVDRVIHGPLCNAALKGTVYVACDVIVKKWDEKPTFLNGCDFSVEPGTIIYVAAHNDTAYYNGCSSCHSSETVKP
jgi:hypothetical protein